MIGREQYSYRKKFLRRKRRRRKLTYDRATSTQPSVSTFPVGLNSAAGCGGSSCSQSANVQTLPASAFKSNIQEYRAPLQNQTQGSREKEGGVSAHQKKMAWEGGRGYRLAHCYNILLLGHATHYIDEKVRRSEQSILYNIIFYLPKVHELGSL